MFSFDKTTISFDFFVISFRSFIIFQPTATMFCVRLIDLGETVCLSPNVRKFELNEMMQQAPPKAMLCSIIRVSVFRDENVQFLFFDVFVAIFCTGRRKIHQFVERYQHQEEVSVQSQQHLHVSRNETKRPEQRMLFFHYKSFYCFDNIDCSCRNMLELDLFSLDEIEAMVS